MEIVDLADRPVFRAACAEWFSSTWGIPARIYAESMADRSVHGVPNGLSCSMEAARSEVWA